MCKTFACTICLQSAVAHGRAGSSTMAGSSRMLPEAAGMGYAVAPAELLKLESTAHASSPQLTPAASQHRQCFLQHTFHSKPRAPSRALVSQLLVLVSQYGYAAQVRVVGPLNNGQPQFRLVPWEVIRATVQWCPAQLLSTLLLGALLRSGNCWSAFGDPLNPAVVGLIWAPAEVGPVMCAQRESLDTVPC